jgi:hypothetical protein
MGCSFDLNVIFEGFCPARTIKDSATKKSQGKPGHGFHPGKVAIIGVFVLSGDDNYGGYHLNL